MEPLKHISPKGGLVLLKHNRRLLHALVVCVKRRRGDGRSEGSAGGGDCKRKPRNQATKE